MAKVSDPIYSMDHMGYPPVQIIWPNYIKIMLFVWHKSKEATKLSLSPFFYAHELQENGKTSIQKIWSYDNLANLFTKGFPFTRSKKLRYNMEFDD